MERLIAKIESEISDSQHSLEHTKELNEIIRLNERIKVSKLYLALAQISLGDSKFFDK